MARSCSHRTFLSLLCVFSAASEERARVVFTERGRSWSFPQPPLHFFLDGDDAVTVVGTRVARVKLLSLESQVPVDLPVEWGDCPAQSRLCLHNVTLVHKRLINRLLACGTDGESSACCDVNISQNSVKCVASDSVKNINERMKDFIIKEGEASALVERPDGSDLYVTYSGAQDFIGVHRFGKHSVRPANRDKEQHYVKLIESKQGHADDALQDKIYGFYNEKHQDGDAFGGGWRPCVTQICTTDTGGPKNNLQFTWTSQLNAPLFCGEKEPRRHFSQLLNVAAVEAELWQDTRVYGLFTNEWGMRAVCVYTIQDIHRVFQTSKFKNSDEDRPRMCAADSTKLPFETLKKIEANSEMEKCIEPENGSGPLLISHHGYTHITAHKLPDEHMILFMSTQDGTVHKVLHTPTAGAAASFLPAEYRPFGHRAHVVGLHFHPSTRRLYVWSGAALLELDVAVCRGYGGSCEECVLARDPFCGWSDGRCAPDGSLQDTEHGNVAICPSVASKVSRSKEPGPEANLESEDAVERILVPLGSRYFFQCPVSSRHARYTWYHDDRPVPCGGAESQCLLLIQSVRPEHEGRYTCTSTEQKYLRVQAQYQLRVGDGAPGASPGPLLFLALLTAARLVQG